LASNPVIKGIELGDMDNMYTMYTSPKKPEPPEGFVDNTVRVFRLNPDGSKGELLRIEPAFPEGWHRSKTDWEKGFQKKKEEVKEMPKKDIDFEAIVAKAKQIMTEQDVSLYKASGIVAQETGLHRTTVYNHARAMLQTPTPEPAAAANQEPVQEKVESVTQSVAQEEPETYDEICPSQDTTLDEMKLIWIEDVMEHCVTVETKMRYIEAIAGLRV
jgi:hypothetical protein